MRSGFALHLLLALVWTLLVGEVRLGHLMVGFGLAIPILALAERLQRQRSDRGLSYTRKLLALLLFGGRFAVALIKANLEVMRDVLTRRRYAKPGVLAVPLRAETDLELLLLANLVTLTPGTLSLEIGHVGGRRVLFVHAMFADDPERVRREIRDTFETPLLELLR